MISYPVIVQNAKTRELSLEYLGVNNKDKFPMPDWAVIVLFKDEDFEVYWDGSPWGYTWPCYGESIKLEAPIWEFSKN